MNSIVKLTPRKSKFNVTFLANGSVSRARKWEKKWEMQRNGKCKMKLISLYNYEKMTASKRKSNLK